MTSLASPFVSLSQAHEAYRPLQSNLVVLKLHILNVHVITHEYLTIHTYFKKLVTVKIKCPSTYNNHALYKFKKNIIPQSYLVQKLYLQIWLCSCVIIAPKSSWLTQPHVISEHRKESKWLLSLYSLILFSFVSVIDLAWISLKFYDTRNCSV